MFEPISLAHDDVVAWVKSSYAKVSARAVVDAFLASLSTRRLDLRSALGSYAIARTFPPHSFVGDRYCSICGIFSPWVQAEDLSVLNFERYKWGGVRLLDPVYIAFDLDQFAKAETIAPSDQDIQMMQHIISVIETQDSRARPRDVKKQLKDVLPSNKAEREVLLQILALCGIMQPRTHKSFFADFVPYSERTMPQVSKTDWSYPIWWWRGSDSVNSDAIAYYFPQVMP